MSTLELAPALACPAALHGAHTALVQPPLPAATFGTTPCLRIWQANIDLQHPVKHLFGGEERIRGAFGDGDALLGCCTLKTTLTLSLPDPKLPPAEVICKWLHFAHTPRAGNIPFYS